MKLVKLHYLTYDSVKLDFHLVQNHLFKISIVWDIVYILNLIPILYLPNKKIYQHLRLA